MTCSRLESNATVCFLGLGPASQAKLQPLAEMQQQHAAELEAVQTALSSAQQAQQQAESGNAQSRTLLEGQHQTALASLTQQLH